jgi:hypothetical protein
MDSKILGARASGLITLIHRYDAGVLALSNKSICDDTCKMLNVTPPYLDKIIDFMLDTGLATIEQRNFFLFLRLTLEGRAIAESGTIPIVERRADNG